MGPNQPTIRRFNDGAGGQSVSAPTGYGYGDPILSEMGLSDVGADGMNSADSVRPPAIPNHQMERLVDKVVEKIEQRVIDELERRGRRHNPGVF
jgi:hypothetical protein